MDHLVYFDIEHDEQSERWQVVTDHPNLSDRIVFMNSERYPCEWFVNEVQQCQELSDDYGIEMTVKKLREMANHI